MTGHQVVLSLDATGQLQAQIIQPLGPVVPIGPAYTLSANPQTGEFLRDMVALLAGRPAKDEDRQFTFHPGNSVGTASARMASAEIPGDFPVQKLAPVSRKLSRPALRLEDIGL